MSVVATEFYDGQGLGNQLWVYSVTRVLAIKTGQSFGILGKQHFKGKEFLSLDFGESMSCGWSLPGGPPVTLPRGIRNHLFETRYVSRSDGMDVSGVDPNFLNPLPNTKIDGNMQCVSYIWENLELIREWVQFDDHDEGYSDYCAIHVRLGDFTGINGPFVGWDYFLNGIAHLRSKYPTIQFRCVSDDITSCRKNLPEFVIFEESPVEDKEKASHHFGGPVGKDFRVLAAAKYLLISNSSFSWWAAVLNIRKEIVIAPKYWARFLVGDGLWSTGDILTPGFVYLDKQGELWTHERCKLEVEARRFNLHELTLQAKPITLRARFFSLVTAWLSTRTVKLLKRFGLYGLFKRVLTNGGMGKPNEHTVN